MPLCQSTCWSIFNVQCRTILKLCFYDSQSFLKLLKTLFAQVNEELAIFCEPFTPANYFVSLEFVGNVFRIRLQLLWSYFHTTSLYYMYFSLLKIMLSQACFFSVKLLERSSRIDWWFDWLSLFSCINLKHKLNCCLFYPKDKNSCFCVLFISNAK